MAAEEIPQRDALELFLVMIGGSEPKSSYFEIRGKRTTGAGMTQDWIPLSDRDRAARSLINRGQMSDTYVGAAPRALRAGGLAAIERVWCLWADCDSEASLRQLASFDPLPSVVIRSGTPGHAHAYWPLRTPVTPAWAKRANQRLALRLGADRNATDAARIMRPPRTFNHKHDPPRPVICTRLELNVFELKQVVGSLSDDPAYAAERRSAPNRSMPVDPSSVLQGLARTVREASVGNRNASLFWAACRVAESELDHEAARQALVAAALDAGLSELEIDQTLDSALSRPVAA